MNQRNLRGVILAVVKPSHFLLMEERRKAKRGSHGYWNNPAAMRPLTIKGSPAIGALLDLISTETDLNRSEALNLLIGEGLKSLYESRDRRLEGVFSPRTIDIDEDQLLAELGLRNTNP